MLKMLKSSVAILCVIGFYLLVACLSANGADYPKRSIRLVVTAGPGGGEDVEIRGLAPFLEKHLGVNLMIENQAGAGGKIAFEKFQKTEPDGYTLLTHSFPKGVVLEYMGKVNFRTRDFVPITIWSRSYQILVVHADSWKTFDEFVKAAKARTLSGGLSGRGSLTHLAGLVAVDELGIKVNWVPYDSAVESTAALAGKHLDFTVCLPTSGASLIAAGRLRGLIVFGGAKDPFFPNIPIPKDLGYNMQSLDTLRGLSAPPNTPASIVKVVEDAVTKAVKEPGFIDFAKNRKMIIAPMSSKEYVKATIEAYPQVERYQEMLRQ
jgi:tripartite-type tricarboxylate transporter receptor subunit TctC